MNLSDGTRVIIWAVVLLVILVLEVVAASFGVDQRVHVVTDATAVAAILATLLLNGRGTGPGQR